MDKNRQINNQLTSQRDASLICSIFSALIIISVLIIGVSVLTYLFWSELIITVQQWQRDFYQKLSQFLSSARTHSLQSAMGLMLFSLLYGIIHSAGPGHGKIIITTYLATQPNQLKKSLMLTILSALMQGIMAILLVSIIIIILNHAAIYLKMGEFWLERASYILIIIVGLCFCCRAIKRVIVLPLKTATHTHQKDCHCCGHKHLPTEDEMRQTKDWISSLGIILSIGIRPCSGALMVLIFSYTLGIYYWGMIASMLMSIGSAITTSLFALLVYFSRRLAMHLIDKKTHNTKSAYLLHYGVQIIALLGGITFIVMGLILTVGMSDPNYSFGNPLLR